MNATPKLAPETVTPPAPVERGLTGCRCPQCGEEDVLSIRICDAVLTCSGCENESDADTLRDAIAAYTRLLAVLDALPPL